MLQELLKNSLFNQNSTYCGEYSSTPQLCAYLNPWVALGLGGGAVTLITLAIVAYRCRKRSGANPDAEQARGEQMPLTSAGL